MRSPQRGTAKLFIDVPDGRMAVGMALDPARRLLFVAGGFTGQAYVYDTRTRATVASYQFGDPQASVINDVAVTKRGAWFTDSKQAKLFFVPMSRAGELRPFRTRALSGPAADTSGEFNLNGVRATAGGKTLIVAHSANGTLHTVDTRTGKSATIAGISVPSVDGIVLAGTGMRIGQALGLRHCDVVSHERRIEIVAREDNANRARGKRGRGWVPITSELVRLHSDYMHEEYGDLDSDYVFVNLWAGRVGHAMTYQGVHEIVRRTRQIVSFHFTPHQFRHTYATVVRRGGVPIEIVSKLLCHRSVQTTSDIYLHASPEDLRAELQRAGVLEALGALT